MAIPKPEVPEDGQGEFNPFLKVVDIGKPGTRATLMLTGSIREADGNFGAQLLVGVKYGKQEYDWAVKLNSPNHRMLCDRFGLSEKKWRGRKVVVVVKPPMAKGMRPFLALERE